MSETKRKGVIEKINETCRECFLGRTPFIMIDTYDRKIVNLFVEKRGIIDFYKLTQLKAFKRLSDDESVIMNAANFMCKLDDFEEFLKSANSAEKIPNMFVLKIPEKNTQEYIRTEEALSNYIDLFVSKNNYSNCVILYGSGEKLSEYIAPFTEIVKVDYPELWEIKEIVEKVIAENSNFSASELETQGLDKAAADIASKLTGFSVVDVEEMVYKLLNLDCIDGEIVLFAQNEKGEEKRNDSIFFKKQQSLNYLGNLMKLYMPESKKKTYLGGESKKIEGFGCFDAWVEQKKERIRNPEKYAFERGSEAIKGVLLTGVPGCGKSASVESLQEVLELPRLKLDVGSLMGGVVGKSERQLREALKTAESMSPIILHIDEIEKGFSAVSSGGNSSSNDIFMRMFAYLLDWMQTNDKVFIFATANDISSMPPELFRSGRFDGIFSVQMPSADECADIFLEMMRRSDERKEKALKKNAKSGTKVFERSCYNKEILKKEVINLAAKKKKFLVGADIEKIVNLAKDLKEVEISHNGKKEKVRINYSKPLDLDTWKHMLITVVNSDDLSTFGMSDNNLYNVARTYINIFNGGFINVSNKSLFKKEKYIAKIGRVESTGKVIVESAGYEGEISADEDSYDGALFKAIKEKIDTIAFGVEETRIKNIISK